MNKKTRHACFPPSPASRSRRGPFRLKFWFLLLGFFLIRLAVPNTESTRAQAAALGTNHSTFPAATANLQKLPQ
jgi:hypothetical protein